MEKELKGGERSVQSGPKVAVDVAAMFADAERLMKLSEAGRDLYGRLWYARRRLAALDDVPAYQVLTNRLILTLSETEPKSREALASTKGIGKTRLEKYGTPLLQVLTGGESFI